MSQPIAPDISIILPVYNGSLYLREAVDSILRQSFEDFELIIIDDGSSDNSAEIILSYADPRIRFYRQKNVGLAATLNRGIALSTGKYIARQDQDDVSLPERLARQVDFLEVHPDYGMVGTWASILEDRKETGRAHRHPEDDLRLRFALMFDNPFVHSSVMVRRALLEKVGGYSTDRTRQPPEDYELWSRIVRESKGANIPDLLHVYREIPQSMSRDGHNPFLRNVLQINAENLAWATGNRFPVQACQDLSALLHGEYSYYSGRSSLRQMTTILHTVANHLEKQVENQSTLAEEVKTRIVNLRYHYVQARYSGAFGSTGRKLIHCLARTGRRVLRGG